MQSETKKPTVLAQLTYSIDQKWFFLLTGLVMVVAGITLIIIGVPDPLTSIIGIIFIIMGTPAINEYSRLIYITDLEVVSETWLLTQIIPIDHTTVFVSHEPPVTEKRDEKSFPVFYISSATSREKIKIYTQHLNNYPAFEKVLKNKIDQHISRLSPKTKKITRRIKHKQAARKIENIKQRHRKIAKRIFVIPGIFLILLGVYGLIEPYFYVDEYHVDSVSGELFLIIIGLIISIYAGLFSD